METPISARADGAATLNGDVGIADGPARQRWVRVASFNAWKGSNSGHRGHG